MNKVEFYKSIHGEDLVDCEGFKTTKMVAEIAALVDMDTANIVVYSQQDLCEDIITWFDSMNIEYRVHHEDKTIRVYSEENVHGSCCVALRRVGQRPGNTRMHMDMTGVRDCVVLIDHYLLEEKL